MVFDAAPFLQNVTAHPGVYQMLDAKGSMLYVGKAGNLKKRLSSYFRKQGLSIKNQSLMNQVDDIQVIITHSETEALILENNLIKAHRPRYNILLRDDKTYPYIHLTDDAFPRLKFYRGRRKAKGKYFGPYPSAGAVKETLDIMQKVFRIRNCDNTFFKNRSRPCLQYQIKRCTAPCVGFVDERQYAEQISDAVEFIEGRDQRLMQKIEQKMTIAADELDFEAASYYRDQLQSLRRVLEKQYITNATGDADVIAIAQQGLIAVIQVFYYRAGRSLGTQAFFPEFLAGHSKADMMQRFIEQMYVDKAPPKELICQVAFANMGLLGRFFQEKFAIGVKFIIQPRGHRARWLQLAADNAELSLYNKQTARLTLKKQFAALTEALSLEKEPALLACVDVSHTQGEATVASYVVFDHHGPKKSDYRKYHINDINGGDDYAAMKQLLKRRLIRLQRQQDKSGIDERLPDVLFVDGGIGQFNTAKAVLDESGIDQVLLIGVAKGADRKAGLERLIVKEANQIIKLAGHHPALHLIQQIRDESHRFAIIGHRKKRDKHSMASHLQAIGGIGEKRRQSLLKYFAGIRGVKSASIEELQKVNGISPKMAAKIYDYFHG